MKFSSIKELENKIMEIKSLNVLKDDITVTTVGETFTVKFLGIGSSAGQKEAVWIGEDNSNTIKVLYSGENDITISKVVVRKV